MRSPAVWLPASLLLAAIATSLTLAQPGCTPREARDEQFFTSRLYWETSFDALSAVCGAGLLTRDLRQDYTPVGRWVLWTAGMLGALLFVGASTQASMRAMNWPPPGPMSVSRNALGQQVRPVTVSARMAAGWFAGTILVALLVIQFLLTYAVYFAGRFFCPTVGWAETIWLVGVGFASLGLASGPVDAGTAVMLAAVGWIGALGWWVWLIVLPPWRRMLGLKRLLLPATAHLTILLIAGGLIALVEAPRGGAAGGTRLGTAPSATLSDAPFDARLTRGITQSICAATAGVPTEPLAERGVRDSSKAILAGLLWLGGNGGSPTGGVRMTLLLAAVAFVLGRALGWERFIFGKPRPDLTPADVEKGARLAECMFRAGVVTVGLLAGLILCVAIGLLVLEAQTASRYTPPPSFADALLDAASAVAGGNLSSGLTAAVTSRNLVSGLGLGINLYQAGMLWMMLAMLVGRVLPIVVLARCATVANRLSPRPERVPA